MLSQFDALPMDKGLEALALGAVLLDAQTNLPTVAHLEALDFGIHAHRLIWHAITGLRSRGERIDRVTVATVLQADGELENIGGISYLVSLDDGLPTLYALDSYARTLRDLRIRRDFLTRINAAWGAVSEPDATAATVSRQVEYLRELQADAAPAELEGYTVAEVVEQAGGLDGWLSTRDANLAIPTPFASLNKATSGGWRRGQLVIWAARPGCGKTIALTASAITAARAGYPATLASLEMGAGELLERIASSETGVPLFKIRDSKYLNTDERRQIAAAIREISTVPFRILDRSALTPASLSAYIQRTKRRHGLALLALDYLGLMGSGTRSERRVDELGYISRRLKILAREEDVAILAAHQLNRSSENERRRPGLHDLRDSGTIEQDADAVVLASRSIEPEKQTLILADLAKQRGGPTGVFPLNFHGPTVTLTDSPEKETVHVP